MELQSVEVAHRIAELGRVARSLRWERLQHASGTRWRSLRIHLGRRLVAIGSALLEGAGSRRPAHSR